MPFCRGRRHSIIMSIAAAAVTMMTTMTAAVAVDMTMRMGMRMCSAENFSCALA